MKISSAGKLTLIRFTVEVYRADLSGLDGEDKRRAVEYLKQARQSQGSEALVYLRKVAAIMEQAQRAKPLAPRGIWRWFGRSKPKPSSELPPLNISGLGGIDGSEQ
jgi:hypothetical protein